MTTDVLEFPALKEAQAKLDAKRKSLFDLVAEAGPEADFNQIKSIQGDTNAKVAEVRKMNAEIAELKKSVDDLRELRKAAENSRETTGAREGGADADDT